MMVLGFATQKIGLVDEVIDSLGPGLHSPEQNTMEYLKKCAVDRARELAAKVRRGCVGACAWRFLSFIFAVIKCRAESSVTPVAGRTCSAF